MCAIEPVDGIHLARSGMSIPGGSTREDTTAEAYVLRVLVTKVLMTVSSVLSIIGAETKHIERGDEASGAKLALELVCRVCLALGRMRVPCICVRKDLATKTTIHRVGLATDDVHVTCSVSFSLEHQPELRHKHRFAMGTIKPVAWVLRTSLRMILTGRAVWEDTATEALVSRIILALNSMSIPKATGILTE